MEAHRSPFQLVSWIIGGIGREKEKPLQTSCNGWIWGLPGSIAGYGIAWIVSIRRISHYIAGFTMQIIA
jgi:hypothetical protein